MTASRTGTTEAVKQGDRYVIPAKGGKTLAVRVTTEPRFVRYGSIDWVGFMAYRVRRDDPSVSFGYEQSYLVKVDDVKELLS